MAFSVIDALAAELRPGARVFEFGAGGSTAFFVQRAARVVSVEHDRAWAYRVRQVLPDEAPWRLLVRPPGPRRRGDPADPEACTSGAFEWSGRDFSSYAASIHEVDVPSFDLVVVDGRSRPACLAAAIPHVAPGGLLLLDNSERLRYQRALERVPPSWPCRHFLGPVRGEVLAMRTTLWRRPARG